MLIKVFSSKTCGPCKLVHKELEKIVQSEDFKDKNLKVKYIYRGTEDNDLQFDIFGVGFTPTMYFSHEGSDYTTIVGFRPEANLRAEIEKHVK